MLSVPGKAGRCLKPGDMVGDYELLVLIGEGGMGVVYRCWHKVMNSEYALKILKPEKVNEQSWQRFQTEARAIAKLDHLHIVKIFNMGIDNGNCPYYVMELLNGDSLQHYIKSKQANLDTTLDIFKQLAAGFGYAHSKGIIHRDIKPDNIILENSEGYTVKIVDFGIAKLVNHDTLMTQGLTSVGEVFGTPLYMSPEQAKGAEIDHRSDIYSLGCTFYKVLTGEFPFRGKTAIETVLLHQSEPVPSLNDSVENDDQAYPNELDELVKRMLAKSPEDRYQTMEQVGRAIERVEHGMTHAGGLFEDEGADTTEKIADHSLTIETIKKPLQITIAAMLICALGFSIYIAIAMVKRPEKPLTVVAKAPPDTSLENTSMAESYEGTVTSSLFKRKKTDFSTFKGKPTASVYVNNQHRLKFYFPEIAIGKLHGNGGQREIAAGTVLIPGSRPIALEIRDIDQATLSHPDILQRIDNKDIDEIWFTRQSILDESLMSDTKIFKMLEFASKWQNLSGISFSGFTPSKELLDRVQSMKHINSFGLKNLSEPSQEMADYPLFQRVSSLNLSGDKDIDPILSAVENSKNLRLLNIDETDPAAETLLKLKSCPNLDYISFEGGSKTDEQLKALSELPALKVLIFRQAKFNEDKILTFRGGFKKLERFGVDNWNASQIEKFHKVFPRCKVYRQLEGSRPTMEAKDY